jgi:hypothetical protein
MLIGDASLFPVRHRYVNSGYQYGRIVKPNESQWTWYDGSYHATDYYYANLFHHTFNADGRVTATTFDTWDADNDNKYNMQIWFWEGKEGVYNAKDYNPDMVDGYPDIALGRIPVHNENELNEYIDKVINYENGYFGKGIAMIAGGTLCGSTTFCDDILNYEFPAIYPGDPFKDNTPGTIGNKIGGTEYITKLGFNFPHTDYNADKTVNCKNALPSGWDNGTFASIRTEATKKWALIYSGHSNTSLWDIKDANLEGKTVSFNKDEISLFQNKITFPIIFNMGCEAGQFKPIPPNGPYMDENGKDVWYYQYDKNSVTDSHSGKDWNGKLIAIPTTIRKPSDYDLSSATNRTFACPWLFQQNGGGAIAFFGETVVCQNKYGRDLVERILGAYSRVTYTLGEAWLEGQRRYWLDFKDAKEFYQTPRIYLSIMTFFGDPTLKIPKCSFSR